MVDTALENAGVGFIAEMGGGLGVSCLHAQKGPGAIPQ